MIEWFREIGLGLVLFLAPALVLAGFLKRGGVLARWTVALSLSPVALGVPVLVLRRAGMDARLSGLIALAAWAAVAILRWGAIPRGLDPEEKDLLRRVAWLLPLVVLPPLVNHYLFIRSDAWFHAGVVAQARNLPLPPQDPYYAGIPLQYFWFFHLILSAYDAVAHLNSFVSMWLFNCVFFASTVAGAYGLSRRLGASHRAALWTPWFVVAAANPMGWGWVLVHLLRSPGHWAGVAPQLPDYVLNLITWRYVSSPLGFALDKFLVGTAFSWGLAFFVWWADCAADFWENGRAESVVLAAALVVASLLVHTVAGATACWGGAMAVALAWVTRPSRVGLARGLTLGAAMLGGALLLYPYLHSVTESKSGSALPRITPNPAMLWTTFWVTLGMLPFWLPSIPALWRAGEASRWVLLLTISILVGSCFLNLNSGNEGKFLHLALLPLAAMAAPAARTWMNRLVPGRPRWRAGILVVVYSPTVLIALGCLLVSHGRASLRPEPPGPGPAELRIYEWVRDSTPAAAVVLSPPGSLQPLVRAERAQVWSDCKYDVLWGYDPARIRPRRDAVEHAFAAGLAPSDLTFLKTLRRPVYRIGRVDAVPPQRCFELEHREGDWVAERLNFGEAR